MPLREVGRAGVLICADTVRIAAEYLANGQVTLPKTWYGEPETFPIATTDPAGERPTELTGIAMSHGAILSRELGLPCVINVVDATTAIRDGDLVRVDGAEGTVRIVQPAATG
jgi:phosphohistidine swiveling domain-containing protein